MEITLADFIYDPKQGVYITPNSLSILNYTDTSEAYLLQVLKNTSDLTSTSKELESRIKDWPSRYHLSVKRGNLFRALEFFSQDLSVLELGAGCGAVTRILGEKFKQVHAVEGNPVRASVAKERCRDLENVKIFSGNIQDITFERNYDVVTLIGVLEYAPVFCKNLTNPEEACLSMLIRGIHALKPEGVLVLAIENRLGLKYWSGCNEDHTGKMFDSIHGYPTKNTPITYSKKQLTQLLKEAGFNFLDFYYPFPDYKICDVVIRDVENLKSYFIHNWLDFPFESYNGRAFLIHEGLLARNVATAGLFPEFTNSFLVLASSAKNQIYKKPNWVVRKIANHHSWDKKFHHEISLYKANGQPKITRKPFLPSAEVVCGKLKFALKHSEFVPGDLFAFSVYEALFSSDFEKIFLELMIQLKDKLLSDFYTGDQDAEGFPLLEGRAIDCTFWNLIRNDDGLFFIDTKWQWLEHISIDYVLFRNLLYFLPKIRPFLNTRPDNLDHYITSIMKSLYSTYSSDRNKKNLIMENEFSTLVRGEATPDSKHCVKTSIIIVTYNSLADIMKCINSIIANTFFTYEMIIVDNVSSDGTQDYVKTLKNAKIILNSKNRGFSRGCNQGIDQARGEYIVLLNPDTAVTKNWDGNLIAHFGQGVGAVGPVSNYVAGLQKIEFYLDEGLPHDIDINALQETVYDRNKGKAVETKLLIGFALMTKKEVIDKVGSLDEDLFLGNDDLEFSLRLRNNGYKLLVATDTFVYHKGQASFNTEPSEKTQRLVQQSTDILYRKLVRLYGAGNVPPAQELWGIDWFQPSHEVKSESPYISIIILTHNQIKYTKKCIESIFRFTCEPFELILVDNGSTDGTLAYLEELSSAYGKDHTGADKKTGKSRRRKKKKKWANNMRTRNKACRSVKVISNEKNLGFAAGNNQGIVVANGDYILLMNNDVVVTPGWLGRMISCAERNPKCGIVGPRSNYVSGPQLVKEVAYDTNTLSGLNKFAKDYSEKHDGRSRPIGRVVGFCMLIKRAVIDKIGGLDTRYGLGNFEDDDFSLRAALAGFESWIAEGCFVHHFGSRTFIGAKIDYRESLNEKWEIFKAKWGMPKGLPYGSYEFSQISDKFFNPAKHYFPLTEEAASTDEKIEFPLASANKKPVQSTKDPLRAVDKSIKASIIIPISKQTKHIKKCFESIKKHTHELHEVVFVNAGAKHATPRWIRERAKHDSTCRVIGNVKYTNTAKAYNAGIRESSGEYIVLLSDDVLVSHGWLTQMLECVNAQPDAGVVGPMTNTSGGRQRVPELRDLTIEQLEEFAKSFRQKNRHRRVLSSKLGGFCIFFSRDLLQKTGLLDESFDQDGLTKEDFVIRAALEGYENFIAGDVFVYQIRNDSPSWNRKKLIEKWRGMNSKDPNGQKLLWLNAIEKAQEAYQKGQTDEAVDIMLKSIGQLPEDENLYYTLSKMLIDSKQFKDACDTLKEIPQKSENIKRLELLGYCKEGLELYDEAEAYAHRMLELNPKYPSALNLKGILAYRKGDKDVAEAFFNRAVESDPGYGEPYTNLGTLKWTNELREEALELYERGIILSPTVTDIVTLYHSAVTELHAFKRAESVLRNASALHADDKLLKYLLTDVLIKQGKHDLAMVEIEDSMVRFGAEDGILPAAVKVREKLGPMEVNKTKKLGTVSLCMIVKDEEKHLPRCLSSAKPIVDEMIVIDTGSTDKTKDIAKVFGAKMYDYEWTNDFSVARNFSLSKASGTWLLVMDADEVISPADYSRLEKIVRKRSNKLTGYSFTTRNYVENPGITGWTSNDGIYGDEEAGTGWYPSSKVRLFSNDPRIRFENPVHELVEPSLHRLGLEIKESGIPIHHYGKLNNEKIISKGEDYYDLGKLKLKDKADDVQALTELAIQAGELGKYEDAVSLWEKVIKIKPDSAKAFHNLGFAHLELGKYQEALKASRKAMELAPDLEGAYLNYSISNLCVGEAQNAISALENLLQKSPDYPPALAELATAYCVNGVNEKAFPYLDKVKRMGFNCTDYLHKRAKRFYSLGMVDSAAKILETAVETENANKDVLLLLSECYKANRITLDNSSLQFKGSRANTEL